MSCRCWLPRACVLGMLLWVGSSAVVEVAAQQRAKQPPDKPRPAAVEAGLKIQLVDRGKGNAERRFVVSGLRASWLQTRAAEADSNPRAWIETMAVTVVSDDAAKPRPMLGDYAIEGADLAFVPRFPLRAGTTYRVEVFARPAQPAPTIARDFTLPDRPKSAPTRLAAIYPSSNVLPENQLKFYLHFSAAMSRGEAYRRIKLIDRDGQPVEFPFLELGEELWDPSGRRFTLFFDPGRIKRGLKPRELFGPALEEGHAYTLVVDQTWRDARGQPLQAAQRKNFTVVAPDNKQPAPNGWQVVTPAAASRQPLVVAFGEPLDHAMLQRVLTVTRAGGAALAGQIVVSKQESQWSFQPDEPWPPGDYALVVDTALEDLAGNSIGRPFEVDVFEKVEQDKPPATIRVPFRVGVGSRE